MVDPITLGEGVAPVDRGAVGSIGVVVIGASIGGANPISAWSGGRMTLPRCSAIMPSLPARRPAGAPAWNVVPHSMNGT
ncbi:MAG: hypothetical protein AB7W59_02000 [Acidimicrobiia bacterium]